MEHWAQLYELWSSQIKAGADLPFQQEFFVNFYQSFLLNDRWMQYLQGTGPHTADHSDGSDHRCDPGRGGGGAAHGA